jgi:hypothetical protein
MVVDTHGLWTGITVDMCHATNVGRSGGTTTPPIG